MSQGDLAKKLDVGPAYVSKIERGIQNVSLRGIEKLAKALCVSPDQLLK
jgi:transcriptional regulator with XRE-family HTH domain